MFFIRRTVVVQTRPSDAELAYLLAVLRADEAALLSQLAERQRLIRLVEAQRALPQVSAEVVRLLEVIR